jgi:AcrR family transcriptional regulator
MEHRGNMTAADGVRAPQQARSQDSTDRMLDVALTLLDRGGMAGLTIAAVSRESGVSNGALYHRFGDRRSLLLAAHDRFLSRLELDWLSASAPIWAIDEPDALLSELVANYLQVFTEHRRTFRAFLMSKDSDVDVRARGLATSERGSRFIVEQLASRFGCPWDAAMGAYQLLYGQAILLVLFDDEDLPAREVCAETRLRQLTGAVAAVLRT